MKIWIYINGMQQGPYAEDEIAAMNLAPSIPVWYEGLPQWMPACEAPATAALLGHSTDMPVEERVETTIETVYVGPRAQRPSVEESPCPPTYMGWSIFSTICCCLPLGILSIVFSSLTSTAYNRGDYAKAEKMSEYAQWAIMLSISLGLPFMVLSSIFQL